MEIPVVSTRISAIPELIDDDVNGCLVTPGSSSEIAAALQRLISNPKERRRLGQMARVKVTREFNIIQCVEQLDALVQSALQNGQAGSEPEPGQAER
jgi:glycosyltransferase involved in cell wall biosynthesis